MQVSPECEEEIDWTQPAPAMMLWSWPRWRWVAFWGQTRKKEEEIRFFLSWLFFFGFSHLSLKSGPSWAQCKPWFFATQSSAPLRWGRNGKAICQGMTTCFHCVPCWEDQDAPRESTVGDRCFDGDLEDPWRNPMARNLKVGSAPLALLTVADPLLATLAQTSGQHVQTGMLPMAMPCWGDAALPCGHPAWEGRAFGHQHWHPGEVVALGQRAQDPPPTLPELPGACRKQTFLPPSRHAANSISAR